MRQTRNKAMRKFETGVSLDNASYFENNINQEQTHKDEVQEEVVIDDISIYEEKPIENLEMNSNEVPQLFSDEVNPSASSEDNLIAKILKTRKKNSKYLRFYVNKNFKFQGKMKNFSSPKNLSHYPVMLDEVLKICNPSNGGNFIDCTHLDMVDYTNAILSYPKTKVLA